MPLSGMGVRRAAWKEAAGGGEVITLSGTSGSPNVSSDLENSPTNALAGWRFQTNGTVYRVVSDTYTQFQDGTEWNDGQDSPAGDFWIRATLSSGDAPTSGPTLGSWHKVSGSGSTNRTWEWEETFNGDASTAGTLQIDISSESDGTPIEDTGYYRGNATVLGTL